MANTKYQQDFKGEELRIEGDKPFFKCEEAKIEGAATQRKAKGNNKKRFQRKRHQKWIKTLHRRFQGFLEDVMEVLRCHHSISRECTISPPNYTSRIFD